MKKGFTGRFLSSVFLGAALALGIPAGLAGPAATGLTQGFAHTVYAASASMSEPEDGGTYYIRCASDTNAALTVKGRSADNRANIVMSKLTKTTDQKFMCRALSDGTYVFTNLYSGKAIRIEGNNPKNAANLWQSEFNSARSGKWKLVRNQGGSYQIASSMDTDYVFSVGKGKAVPGANVELYKSNRSRVQNFIFTRTPEPDYSGTVQLRPLLADQMCAAPAGGSRKSGSAITLSNLEKSYQTYDAIRYSAGYYVLVNRRSGLVLSLKEGKAGAGVRVIQEERNNRFCQQWLIRKNPDGTFSYLSRLNSTLAISVEKGVKKAGIPMILSTFKNYSSQKYCPGVCEGTEETLKAEDHILFDVDSVAAGGTEDGAGTDGVTLEDFQNGLIIAGNGEAVNGLRLSMDTVCDFGSADEDPICRVMIDGLTRGSSPVECRLYLDDDDKPFASKVLSVRDEKRGYSDYNPAFIELAEPVTGMHTLSMTFDTGVGESEILIRAMRFYRETLPVINVNIDESLGTVEEMKASAKHEAKCYGSMNIRVPEGYENRYAEEGLADYAGGEYELEYIRGRGTSTWTAPKKPYKVRLDKKANLFGMGSNKTWALMAGYYDRSFVRNAMTSYLAEAMNMPATPKMVPVEVVINGNYEGLYFLSETVRIGKSRVDIDDLEDIEPGEDDLTGGYLLRVKRQGVDYTQYICKSPRNMCWVVDSPDKLSDENVPAGVIDEMHTYIDDYIDSAEDALFGDGFRDKDGVPYTEYMDLESAAQFFLIQELSHNGDGYWTDSNYMYKTRNGKLYWGPVWDFDCVAWGSSSPNGYSTDEKLEAACAEGFIEEHPWIARLREDPSFVDMVKELWGGIGSCDPDTLAYNLNELIKDGGLLDQWEQELTAAASCNADTANPGVDLSAEYEIPDEDMENAQAQSDLHGEIARLKRWIRNRMQWFDAHLDELLITDVYAEVTFVSDGEVIETRSVYKKEQFRDLPVPPQTEGRYFAGWYVDVSYDDGFGPSEIEGTFYPGDYVPVDMTMTAQWVTEEEAPEMLTQEQRELEMNVEDRQRVPVTVFPEGVCGYMTYVSSDPDVASVNGRGYVLAEKAGDAVITVTAVNGLTAEFTVHVNPEE